MKNLLIYVVLSTILFSCSSDDDTVETENFYALKVGNSWVYKYYEYDEDTHSYLYTGIVDSVSVIGTEKVNNQTYFKTIRKSSGNENRIFSYPGYQTNPDILYFENVRDSLGFLVRSNGLIKFTNSSFEERILGVEDWGTAYEKLVPDNTEITTEAGTFTCINSERFARNTQGELFQGRDRFYYADRIGLIYETASSVSSDTPLFIRRLTSYDIK